eukprot:GCRY01000983.1.p1 GENE.GCRY01000983.1~~GCRY01000983.1.p1  ORF type:complete len:421 (+),score=54.62 GCRY01000983.1:393-1655(+)
MDKPTLNNLSLINTIAGDRLTLLRYRFSMAFISRPTIDESKSPTTRRPRNTMLWLSEEEKKGKDKEEDSPIIPYLDRVYKEGRMFKRGGQGHTFMNWKKRWFVLRTKALYYYESEPLRETDVVENKLLKGSVILRGAVLKEITGNASGKENCFSLTSLGGKEYIFSTSTPTDKEEWMDLLQKNIDHENLDSFETSVSGWLYKSGGGKLKGLKKRWFRSNGPILHYFDKQQIHPDDFRNLKGSIDLFRADVSGDTKWTDSKEKDKDKAKTFTIQAMSGRVYSLIASSEESKATWVESLSKICDEALDELLKKHDTLEFSGTVGGSECEGKFLLRTLRLCQDHIELLDTKKQRVTLSHLYTSISQVGAGEEAIQMQFGIREDVPLVFYTGAPRCVVRAVNHMADRSVEIRQRETVKANIANE